jgi:hypothetical protein
MTNGLYFLGFSNALPEWLLWGGRTEKSNENENYRNIIDHEDDIIDRIDIDKVSSQEEAAVKSSVQARFSIELKWTPPKTKHSEQKGFRGFFKLFFNENNEINSEDDLLIDAAEYIDIDEINSKTNHEKTENINSDMKNDEGIIEKKIPENNGIENKILEENRIDSNIPGRDIQDDLGENELMDKVPEAEEYIEDKIEDILPVTAVVKVWVDVNLPVNKELSSTLSFPPVKVFIFTYVHVCTCI